MPRVVHIVTTANFAGVERYVCDVATETARRGWDVAVVGGHPERMPTALGDEVRWRPGHTAFGSVSSVLRLGRRDVCHAHMTIAEAVAVATRRVHCARIVSTRHFAAPRGASRAGRIVAPWIAARLAREIAMSEFVARHLERPPSAVAIGGVRPCPCLWRSTNRVVLVMQRLEPEKETLTALRAWQLSQMVDEGWTLRVVGEGSQRGSLELCAAREGIAGVTFADWTANVRGELEGAGILLAPAPADSFGLGVVEAMAAGVPVAACASGGHLETVGLLPEAALFAPRDGAATAATLRSLLSEEARARISSEGRRLVTERFTIERHVDLLLTQYDAARAGRASDRAATISEALR
jgi:glycosyltransferase involved in cell wall biosynthesis